jgi:DNA polymerase-3 subunit delta'
MSLFGDEFDDDVKDDDIVDVQVSEETLQPPQKSDMFLGHETQEQEILNAWNAGRMPHAIVMNGVQGIGKATFAYRLARFILKQSADNGGLFGEDVKPETLSVSSDHPVFSKIASGGHTDLLTITRPFDEKKGQFKSEIPVGDIRKVAPFLRQTSGAGGWRVVIIDDSNTMNRNGQNALLKILEEPPKNALLILVTHGSGGLLPTIRSRCRFMAFDVLNDTHVKTLLNTASDVPIMPADMDILTAMADGSAGQAIALLNEGGIEAVNIMLNALARIDDMSIDQIDALALSYGKSGDAKTITQFHFILNWWFEKIIMMAVNGQSMQTIGHLDLTVPQGRELQSLLRLHEDVEAHIQACIHGNLDKRYMIFKTLRMVQG